MRRCVSDDGTWELITRVDSSQQFSCVTACLDSPLREKRVKKSTPWKEVGGRTEKKKGKEQSEKHHAAATIYAVLAKRSPAKKKGEPCATECEGFFLVPSFMTL